MCVCVCVCVCVRACVSLSLSLSGGGGGVFITALTSRWYPRTPHTSSIRLGRHQAQPHHVSDVLPAGSCIGPHRQQELWDTRSSERRHRLSIYRQPRFATRSQVHVHSTSSMCAGSQYQPTATGRNDGHACLT